MQTKAQLLTSILREEVKRQLREFDPYVSSLPPIDRQNLGGPIAKSGPFTMKKKIGNLMKYGKSVYNRIMYYDDPGYYEVTMPLTDASGRSIPKKKMFFDSAQEAVDWFRKTDSKYDWATAMNRIEKDKTSIYDYD
jgi:hypothetical protein